MARQLVGIGSSANDGTGDTLRDGIDKVNDNFIEIYGKIGNGTTIGTFTTTDITSTGDFTIDGSADIILDADGGDVFFKDAGTTFGSATNTSGNLIVKSGTTTALTFSGANVTAAGTIGSGAITSTGVVTGTGFTIGSAVINEAELETIDGITAGTVAASKAIVVDSNKAINELTVDDVAINGKVVTMTGSSGDTAVFTAGTNGTLDITTTDTAAAAANIQITADGTAELAGTTVTLDSGGGITLDADGGTITFADASSSLGTITSSGFTGNVVGNVTGNTSGTAATVTTAAQTNITSLGTLTTLTVDDVVINGKVVTMTGSTSDTAVFTAGTNGTLSIVTTDDSAAAANITITADGTAELAGTTVTLNSSGGITLDADGGTITFADASSSLGTITSSGFTGNVVGNVTGNTSGTALTVTQAAQTAITSVGTLTALTVDDVDVNGKVIVMTGSTDDTFTTTVGTNGATSLVTVDTAGAAGHLTITADGTVDINSAGVLTLDSGAAINIEPASGSAILLDGTISIDAGVVTGATSITSTAFVGDITGDVTGTADVATVATTVTITDNESTDESNAIIFTAGGDVDGGNIGLESDGTLTYNPSTGKITATGFVGALTGAVTGNVTGNASGTALTVTQAAQTSITSVGTLTALTVDDVVIDGKVMTMTGSSSDTAVFTAGTNGTLSIVTTDAAAAAANIQITADGTAELAGTTVTLDSEGDIVLDANGADIFFKDDGTTFGSATNSSGNLIVKSGTTTALTFAGANVTAAGTVDSGAITSTGVVTGTGFTIGSAAILEAELEILDGATVTTTELNLLDGGTDVGGGITVADADGFIVNDAGTMKTIPASSVKTYAATTVTVPASYNMIINGDMSVAQRGKTITDAAVANVSTTSNADDSYTLDRWILISDGDNIVDVTQEHDGPTTGGPKSIRLDVETVDKQFGIVQWIEHINCSEAIGGNVSLSFSMKVTGAKMDDVRAAVVSWSGTRDAPTSDIVATWESEGTVPTLASSCTYENTAADLSPTTSWARYTIENVSVDTSSTANIGVFIWSGVDDTDAGNFLYVTDVQLETSASAHAFKRQPVSQTMKDCERYYETSMDWGQDQQYAGQKVVYGLGSATYAATVSSIGGIQYRTRKRLSPTVVIYDQDGLAGSVYTIHSGTRVSSTVAAQHTIDYGFLFATKTNAFSHGYAYYYAYTAESEL